MGNQVHRNRLRHHITESLRAFARSEDGAAIVEFGLVLPMMLVVFAVIIEGSRLMLSFQSAVAGVRDATRYLARVVPGDICQTGGSVSSYSSQLQTIVSQSTTGQSVFPAMVTVNSVTPSVSCVAGTFRVSPAPVVEVTANVTLTFPFGNVFGLLGTSQGPMTTNIRENSKAFGI